MRKLLVIVVLIGTLLGLGFFLSDKKYNIVIFAFDGLQAHHIKAYGYTVRDVTPHLNSFFDSAFVFTNTTSAASWTVPSFMSIFTSLYPSEHKLTNKLVQVTTATGTTAVKANLSNLNPNAVTLAEILKRHGYVTGGFTGDAGVSGAFGYSHGFDTYYDKETFGGFEISEPPAITWLDEHKNDQFFMFVHGYDVHGQHAPVGGFDYRYVTKPYTGTYTGSTKEQGALREQGLKGPISLSKADIDFWNAIYDEKINDADAAFGVFMKHLDELHLADKTIVVVISDHGTEFMEHGKFDHGHTLYKELLDTVFAIRAPGVSSGKSNSLVSSMDIAPTILSLAGISDPSIATMRGTDISPAFNGKDVSHDVFSETDYRLFTHKRSITTTDGWVFILTRVTNDKELYDIHTDPLEKNNLIAKEPQIAYRLEQKLLTHLNEVGDVGPWPLGCLAVYADQCH